MPETCRAIYNNKAIVASSWYLSSFLKKTGYSIGHFLKSMGARNKLWAYLVIWNCTFSHVHSQSKNRWTDVDVF
jgi:hypothetical protein